MVAWNWKGANATVTNTAGNVDTQVSANPDAGFSIVGWTNTADAVGTRGHGLSKAPEFMARKVRDTTGNWSIYHIANGAENHFDWASNRDERPSTWLNDTAPSATLINVGTPPNYGDDDSDGAVIEYCWHSVDGFSKVGSYKGNGNADGTFIYTGFRPAYFLVKNRPTTGRSWRLYDNKRVVYNAINKVLYIDVANVDTTTAHPVDFLSNGIKIRGTFQEVNTDGEEYMYLAFAETPFKYSNAR